ncbi:MAG: tRNA (adenosine(37)-N6)-threonylcarbamoyltransferase complex ATPase subunit type 1 TsaE [Nitrospirae bacterium]|nr:tRNA (adenosine(37)-N6)-threonylcarbamoyltransferase complex ATPase subunit type 1 TsaE [Nitrospirota bacterium]
MTYKDFDYTITTNGPDETKKLGERLGRLLKEGDIICLHGELGAGKTSFTQGIAKGMDVAKAFITSPTFVIVNEYKGRLALYHIDLYRLNNIAEIEDIGLSEYLKGEAVTVIEWAEKAEGLLSEERLSVYLENSGGDKRSFTFKATGKRYEEIVQGLG